MSTIIKIRRDTAAAWSSANPVLAGGELALETDTGKLKVGNGAANWAALPYEVGRAALQAVADAVSGKYAKPSAGIPLSDLAQAVRDAIAAGSSGSAATTIAGVQGLQSALDGKATPAQITAAVDALKASAPAAFDTLAEIAAELARGVTAESALTTAIGAKYAKPSTGIPLSDLAVAVQTTLNALPAALDARPTGAATAGTLVLTLAGTGYELSPADDGMPSGNAGVFGFVPAWVGPGEFDYELRALPSGSSDESLAAIVTDRGSKLTKTLQSFYAPRTLRAPLFARSVSSRGARTQSGNSTVLVRTSRVRHTITEDAEDLSLLFVNWNAGETPGANDIVVKASIEIAGTAQRVFFGGQRERTIAPGGWAQTNPLGVAVAKGDVVWVRTTRTITAGSAPVTVGLRGSFGEGVVDSDMADSGTITAATDDITQAYGPTALLAGSSPGRSVAVFGDSVSNGTGETVREDGGYIARALGTEIAIMRLNGAGNTAKTFINSASTDANAGLRRLPLSAGARFAWVEYGINDVNAGDTLETIQASLTKLWTSLARRGMPVWQSTLTPWSSSTDTWATVENQTPFSKHAVRIAVNDWIRSVPAPLTGVFDVAAIAESSLNSGKYLAGGTTDGIHPTTAVHTAIAAGIATQVAAAFESPVQVLDTIAPTTPGTPVATAGVQSASLVAAASTDNVGVTGYRWYRGGQLVGSTAGPTFTENGLAAGTAMTWTVEAFDAASNVSARSAASNAVTPTAPSATYWGQDAFTDTDGVLLAAHTPTVGGAWLVDSTGSDPVIDGGRVHNANSTGGRRVRLQATPPSADYTAAVDLTFLTAPTSSSANACAAVRLTSSGAAYVMRYLLSAGGWRLDRLSGGSTAATLQTVAFTPTAGQTVRLATRATGSLIEGLVDGVVVCTGTDTTLPAAGNAGLVLSGAATATTGVHLDNFTAGSTV